MLTRIQRLVHPSRPAPRSFWLPTALLAAMLPLSGLALKAAADPPIPGAPALIQELDALAVKEGLDPHLLRALAWVESGLNREARSPLDARGVLQVMPETARKHGATDLQDRSQVMAAGARYLHTLLDRYQGDVAKAVAAYNGGEKAVDSGALSAETRAYVPMVMSVYQARAVQPESALEPAAVEGVVRRLGDGTLSVALRLKHRGSLDLEVLEDTAAQRSLARMLAGYRDPQTQAEIVSDHWSTSTPRIKTHPTQASSVLVRATDQGLQRSGEVRLALDGSWKTFSFTMTPRQP